MIVNKQKYISSLKSIMDKYYSVLKNVGSVPVIWEGYVNGYIEAGLLLEVACKGELDIIIQESHQRVFGMSIDERKQRYKKEIKREIDENELDIPTFIRIGSLLDL